VVGNETRLVMLSEGMSWSDLEQKLLQIIQAKNKNVESEDISLIYKDDDDEMTVKSGNSIHIFTN
jgi:hypothetical protein